MFSPLKRYKTQHQEFKCGVFRSISGPFWALEKIFFSALYAYFINRLRRNEQQMRIYCTVLAISIVPIITHSTTRCWTREMSKPSNNGKVTQKIVADSDYISSVPNHRAVPRVTFISYIDGRKNRKTIGTRVYGLEIIEIISMGRNNIIHLVCFHLCSNLLLALNNPPLIVSRCTESLCTGMNNFF